MRTVLNAPIDCISNDGVAAATVRAKGFGHQQINILCDPFEPTVGYQRSRHRRAMSVVVVGVSVAVDEVLPSDEVDALQIGVIIAMPESTMQATTPLPVNESGAG